LFGRLNALKLTKRQAGADIIDLGMGNPSDPAPKIVVDKLCEAARDPRNHRYSAVKGIKNLRKEVTKSSKWYFYDKEKNNWVLKSTLTYSLMGGRDGGYRGYSYKKSLLPGAWKIETTNEKGQILGSKKFVIKEVFNTPILQKGFW
jgi:hypothetical protein